MLLEKYQNKRKIKEPLHPSLEVRGNVLVTDENKAEVLQASFASVFTCKASCSQGIQPPELEDCHREEDEVSVIQQETLSDLLHHLNIQKSIGLDRIHPRVLNKPVEVLTRPLSRTRQHSWLTGEVPDG